MPRHTLVVSSLVVLGLLGCNRADDKQQPGPTAGGKSDQPSANTLQPSPTSGQSKDAQSVKDREEALRKQLTSVLWGRKYPDSNKMLNRMATSTVDELRSWTEAFQKIQPKIEKKEAGFLMFKIDLLYKDDGAFVPEYSAKYCRRFKSIPLATMKGWASGLTDRIPDEVSAGILIMEVDALFDKEGFQTSQQDLGMRVAKEVWKELQQKK